MTISREDGLRGERRERAVENGVRRLLVVAFERFLQLFGAVGEIRRRGGLRRRLAVECCLRRLGGR